MTFYVMRPGDKAIVTNLRYRWGTDFDAYTDEELAEEYAHFSLSELFGNNDERFSEYLWLGLG